MIKFMLFKFLIFLYLQSHEIQRKKPSERERPEKKETALY